MICLFYAILMRTKKFETRLQLNSNFENHDIELKKQLKMKKHLMKTRKEKKKPSFTGLFYKSETQSYMTESEFYKY